MTGRTDDLEWLAAAVTVFSKNLWERVIFIGGT
jgi:hypothetical protein